MVALGSDALRFRRPWYWLAVLVLAAALASALVVRNGAIRIAQNERQFRSLELLRLQNIRQRLDVLFSDAEQLDQVGAVVFAHSAGDRALTARLAREIFGARIDWHIYGMGSFFARGAFGTPGQLFSVYERRTDLRVFPTADDATVPGGGIEVLPPPGEEATDYTRSLWYRRALEGHGRPVVWGPYSMQKRSFISTLRAFYRNGKPAGVVSVDTLASEFQDIMSGSLAPHDVAWVAGANGAPFVTTGALPGGARIITSLRLQFTPLNQSIVLSADASTLEDANRAVVYVTGGIVLAMLLCAAFLGLGIVQRWRASESRYALELEQARLEREIATSRIIEVELRRAAYTDALTGLPNRAPFLERVRAVIDEKLCGSHAVFFIDLDRFNIVNETLGHLAGDELLRSIGARLGAVIAQPDMIARLGGDEFVVIVKLDENRPLKVWAELLLSLVGQPIIIEGRSLYPEASMGVVAMDEAYTAPEELLRDADIAMYEAKNRGRARHVVFDAEMRKRIARDSELEHDLRRGIERGEFVPYYQPIVDVKTQQIASFEALVRWHRTDGRVIQAGEFMPFAEAHGMVAAIDGLMARGVCGHSRAILDLFPGASIAINVSAYELATPVFAQMLHELMLECGCPADRIRLEITETAMMANSEAVRRTLEHVQELGMSFVLDDFGTGYSSLAYLQRLPIKGIKIDRAFVTPLLDDPKAVELIRSVVMLARSFGLWTTAEGVETLEQFELLAQLDVDYAQGFFFSRAVDIASLVRLQNGTIFQTAVE